MRKLFAYVLVCSFVSCVKDKPNPDPVMIPGAQTRAVIVLNEGSYGNNNAEITLIEPAGGKSSTGLFKAVNHTNLGDVANTIVLIDGKYYITVNNSHKIVVLDPLNYLHLSTISGIQFPRQIASAGNNKAYVSSLYNDHIYVVDLQQKTISKTIATPFKNTESLLIQGAHLWCCSWDTASELLYKIDIQTDELTESVVLPGRAPHEIACDRNGKLWVLGGNKYKNTRSFLCCYDPVAGSVINTFFFDSEADPFRLQLNAGRDTLYYIQVNYLGNTAHNGVYRMGIYESALPGNAWLPASLHSYYWGLGIDTLRNEIYVSDPKGFTQQSTVLRVDANANVMAQYEAGIGANSFLFR